MANEEKVSFFAKFLKFVTDKRKLPLLLALLGGTATVVTGTIILANPGTNSNGNGSSQATGGSSQLNTSQTSGSIVPFSGNEVPEWNFDNATLDGSATTLGVGYDFNWFSRYQNQYFYQVGRNYIPGAPTTNNQNTERYTEMLFSIYNMRTTQVDFLYHFEVSAARRAYMLETQEYDQSYSWIRMAYDQQSTILVLLTLNLPQNNGVALGGSYAPIETYLQSRFNLNSEEYYQFTVLLKFSINDRTQYTILDGFADNNQGISVEDLLIEDGKLFLSTQVNKNTIDNSQSVTNQYKFSFLQVPQNYPSFVNYQNNYSNPGFSYLVEVDITNYQAMTTLRTTAITFDGNSTIWFYGYRQGFETKYLTEAGEMALGLNGYVMAQNEASITTYFSALESNFLTEEESTNLYGLIENKTKDFYNRTLAYINNLTTSINYNVFGFYSFETGKLTKNNFSIFSWQTVTVDNVQYQFNNYYSSFVIAMNDGVTAFKIEFESASLFPIQQNNFGGWSNLNPDYRIYTYNAVSSVNLNTNVITLIEENDDNGKYVTGIYQKNGGYYISGTYYECEAKPTVQSTDAFLIQVDESFTVVDELILAGSGDDNGSQITLNAQGRPVWLVQSNSTDGDFATAGASNTEGRFKLYSVSF